MKRLVTRLAVLAGLLIGAFGISVVSAPSASADLTGCELRQPPTPVEGYVGDFVMVDAGITGNGVGCSPETTDVVTFTLPAHLEMSGGAFAQSYDNGMWTCSWPIGGGQVVSCSPNQNYTQAANSGTGIWFTPGVVAGASAPIEAAGPGVSNLSIPTASVTCTTPIPMFDPEVLGVALGAAAIVGGGVFLLRRRRMASPQPW